jgi:hypothetical protein
MSIDSALITKTVVNPLSTFDHIEFILRDYLTHDLVIRIILPYLDDWYLNHEIKELSSMDPLVENVFSFKGDFTDTIVFKNKNYNSKSMTTLSSKRLRGFLCREDAIKNKVSMNETFNFTINCDYPILAINYVVSKEKAQEWLDSKNAKVKHPITYLKLPDRGLYFFFTNDLVLLWIDVKHQEFVDEMDAIMNYTYSNDTEEKKQQREKQKKEKEEEEKHPTVQGLFNWKNGLGFSLFSWFILYCRYFTFILLCCCCCLLNICH